MKFTKFKNKLEEMGTTPTENGDLVDYTPPIDGHNYKIMLDGLELNPHVVIHDVKHHRVYYSFTGELLATDDFEFVDDEANVQWKLIKCSEKWTEV